jgi:DNA-binding MarR family transcriptional regulator
MRVSDLFSARRRYHSMMIRPKVSSTATSGNDRAQSGVASTRVLRQFRQIFNAVKAHFQQVERRVGLGGAQVWALSVIRDTPDIGVGSLARAMNIHQSTASNLVKSLVERGLVSAAKQSADRRAVTLRLLAAGARILKRSPGPFAGVLPEALASLDQKTLKRMEADLKKLIGALDADADAADIPLAEL